jgi:predicted Zn-dependent protease
LEAQVNLACIYTETKPDRAIELFSRSINRVSPDPMNFRLYGQALATTKQYAPAEKALRRSVELDGREPHTHQLLSDVLKAQGKQKESEIEAKTAKALASDQE